MKVTQWLKRKLLKPVYEHAPPPAQAYWAFPTAIASAVDDVPPGDDLLRLGLAACRAAAERVNLDDVAARPGCKVWLNVWPGEHYKLLAGLVLTLRPRVVVEIGTAEGLSALSMKKYMPPDGVVHSFDLVPWDAVPDTLLAPADFADGRLVQHLGDLTVPEVFDRHRELLASADFIFVDGPKDDRFEWKLVEHLRGVNFTKPPLLMFDDTRLWPMLRFWRELRSPKLDLTSMGHSSGSGLVRWQEGK